jgi:predicted Fe-Mo cluster-binding NifX family protein
MRDADDSRMNIAITTSGASLDAPLDPRFGRAARFIVVKGDAFTVHDNTPNLNATQGAGIQAAEAVSQLGANVVITGHCGPKAFRALQAAGIQVVTGAAGTVREAVARFQRGELQTATAADVEGHWM